MDRLPWADRTATNEGTPSYEDYCSRMNYFAHTVEDDQGRRLTDESRWQLLRDHLRTVASLAKEFGRPLGLEAEAGFAAHHESRIWPL